MLRFAVYDERDRTLVNPHLVGPDDMPIRGDVTLEDGMIVCRKPAGDAAGVCLLYDAGPMGKLMLQTCLLPERDEPYILAVELARHRIKMFIAKSEEWQMFDLSAEHPAMILWEQARRLLTDAWTSEDPKAADRVARESLIKAVEATERLALAHADILLHRRYAARPASNATLGVRIWPGRDDQPLKDLVQKEFDLISIPLVWKEIEAKEGRFNWDPVDRWMEWASKQGKPILAGPLLDFSKRAMPDWMYVWQHDYDTCRDLTYDHLEKVVARYRGAVGMWNLGAGLNVNDNFRFTPEQMLDLTRMAALLIRQAAGAARSELPRTESRPPKAPKVMIELTQPWGEHAAFNRESIHPLAFVDRLVQEGVRLDAVGVQVLFGRRSQGQAARDLMQVSAMLDRFFLLELPIVISAMGVPSAPIDALGGTWQEPWSPEVQARWTTRMFAIGLSKPFVETIFWSDLYDYPEAELPGAGLIAENGRPKPVLQKLAGLRRHLRKPLGPLKLPSRAAAQASPASQ